MSIHKRHYIYTLPHILKIIIIFFEQFRFKLLSEWHYSYSLLKFITILMNCVCPFSFMTSSQIDMCNSNTTLPTATKTLTHFRRKKLEHLRL